MKNGKVKIAPFEGRFQPFFKSLNEAWIRSYGWEIEAADSKTLDYPQENIIDRGGFIFIALCEGEPAGTLAMFPLEGRNGEFELAKFAVSPAARKNGIGESLMRAAFDKAREVGARRLYLESNTRCESAIRMYRRLGFREIEAQHSEFERCNIQMEFAIGQSRCS